MHRLVIGHACHAAGDFLHQVGVGLACVSQGVVQRREAEAAVSRVLHDFDDIAFAVQQLEGEGVRRQSLAGQGLVAAELHRQPLGFIGDGQLLAGQAGQGVGEAVGERSRAIGGNVNGPAVFAAEDVARRSGGFFQRVGTAGQAGVADDARHGLGIGIDQRTVLIPQGEDGAGQHLAVRILFEDAEGDGLVGDDFLGVGAGVDDCHAAVQRGFQRGGERAGLGVLRNEHVAPLPGLRVQHVAGGRLRFFDQQNLPFCDLLHEGDQAVAVGKGGSGLADGLAGGVQLSEGESSAGESGRGVGFGVIAADLQQADADLVGFHAEAAALIGGVHVEGDFHRRDGAPLQGGGVLQRHILRAHRLGGLDLVGQAQGRAVGYVDGEALTVFGETENVAAGRDGAALLQCHTGFGIDQAEGVLQVDEGCLTIAHGVLQQQCAVRAEGQSVGVDVNAVGDLVAGGGQPLGALVQHEVADDSVAGDGGRIGDVAPPFHGSAVGHGHGNGDGAAAGLVQRGLQRTGFEYRVVLYADVAADPGTGGAHGPGPVAAGLDEGQGESVRGFVVGEGGVGLRGSQVNDSPAGGVVDSPYAEGGLPAVPGDAIQRHFRRQRIGDGDGDRIGVVPEFVGADGDCPADLLVTVAVIIMVNDVLLVDSGAHGLADGGILAVGVGGCILIRELHASHGVIHIGVIGDVPLLFVGGGLVGVVDVTGNTDVGKEAGAVLLHQRLDSRQIELNGEATAAIRAQIVIRMGLTDGEVLAQRQPLMLAILSVYVDLQRQVGEHAIVVNPHFTIGKGILAGRGGQVHHDQLAQAVEGDLLRVLDLDEPLGHVVVDEVFPRLFQVQPDVLAQLGIIRAGNRPHAGTGDGVLVPDGPFVGHGAEVHRIFRHQGVISQLELTGAVLRVGGEAAGVEGEGFVACGIGAEVDVIRVGLAPQLDEVLFAVRHVVDIKGGGAIDEEHLAVLHRVGDHGGRVGHAPVEGHVPADELAPQAFLVIDDVVAGVVHLDGAALDEGGGGVDGSGDVLGAFVDVVVVVDGLQHSLVGEGDGGVGFAVLSDFLPGGTGQGQHRVRHLAGYLQVIGASRQLLIPGCGDGDGAVIAADGGADGGVHGGERWQTIHGVAAPEILRRVHTQQLHRQIRRLCHVAEHLIHHGEGGDFVPGIHDDVVIHIVVAARAVHYGVAGDRHQALINLVAIGDGSVPGGGSSGRQGRFDALHLQGGAVFHQLDGVVLIIAGQAGRSGLTVHQHGVLQGVDAHGQHAAAAGGEGVDVAVMGHGDGQAGNGALQGRLADDIASEGAVGGSDGVPEGQQGGIVRIVRAAGDVHVLVEGEGDGVVHLILAIAVLGGGSGLGQLVAGAELKGEALAGSREIKAAILRFGEDGQRAGETQLRRIDHGVDRRLADPLVIEADADLPVLNPPAEQRLAVVDGHVVIILRVDFRRVGPADIIGKADVHRQVHRAVVLQEGHQLPRLKVRHHESEEQRLSLFHIGGQRRAGSVRIQAGVDGGIIRQRRRASCLGGDDAGAAQYDRQQQCQQQPDGDHRIRANVSHMLQGPFKVHMVSRMKMDGSAQRTERSHFHLYIVA